MIFHLQTSVFLSKQNAGPKESLWRAYDALLESINCDLICKVPICNNNNTGIHI